MLREGPIIFRDLVGKLQVPPSSATSAADGDDTTLDPLIEKYGIDAKLFEWSDEITGDCPRKPAKNLNDMCGARCPDLSKVVLISA